MPRPGAPESSTSTSYPTSVSFAATYSAASRSPTVPSGSPVLVVSIAMSCEASSTTSSSAALVMVDLPTTGPVEGPPDVRLSLPRARQGRALVRVAEWQTR